MRDRTNRGKGTRKCEGKEKKKCKGCKEGRKGGTDRDLKESSADKSRNKYGDSLEVNIPDTRDSGEDVGG